MDIDEMELAKLFASYGAIGTIKIVRDKKTRKCKGYAFIEMIEISGAKNAAAALNNTIINGKALTVTIRDEVVPHTSIAEDPSPDLATIYQKVPQREEVKKKRQRKTFLYPKR